MFSARAARERAMADIAAAPGATQPAAAAAPPVAAAPPATKAAAAAPPAEAPATLAETAAAKRDTAAPANAAMEEVAAPSETAELAKSAKMGKPAGGVSAAAEMGKPAAAAEVPVVSKPGDGNTDGWTMEEVGALEKIIARDGLDRISHDSDSAWDDLAAKHNEVVGGWHLEVSSAPRSASSLMAKYYELKKLEKVTSPPLAAAPAPPAAAPSAAAAARPPASRGTSQVAAQVQPAEGKFTAEFLKDRADHAAKRQKVAASPQPRNLTCEFCDRKLSRRRDCHFADASS